jgi:hypothetical protein
MPQVYVDALEPFQIELTVCHAPTLPKFPPLVAVPAAGSVWFPAAVVYVFA